MNPIFSKSLFGLVRPASTLAALVGLGVLASACGQAAPPEAIGSGAAEPVAKSTQALAGVDSNVTVSAAGTIVNQYTSLATAAAANATTITVASVAALSAGADALVAGDLIMLAQMQGATINTAADSAAWGTVTAVNGAGLYEMVEVLAVNAGTNTITLSCGLKNAYSVTGVTQVVRVPQYDTLTIASGASIVAPAWNGSVGGIVAVHARSTVTLTGSIDVTGLGFRGGAADDDSTDPTVNTTTFAGATADLGALKGEGIAGVRAEFGRAPAANGGGGGTAHNGGGGGGANGRFGATWTGQGSFDLTVTGGATAWLLDPNYSATASQGGGRGGYSYSQNAGDALTVAPGNAAWGGNNRRQRGGLGGHAVDNDPANRIFFGGGGGAGDGNNGHAGRGGRGGGIVILIAGSVGGAGQILANGEAGQNAVSTAGGSASGDSPGGGGGGGSVIVQAPVVTSFAVQAMGGVGGNQLINNVNECEGPGGGGGGGYVFSSGTLAANVAGALGGTTNCPPIAEFPSNGATRGGAGQTAFGTAAVLPYCVDTTIPETTIVSSPANPTSDTTGDFTFSSPDASATFQCSLDNAAFTACTTPFATAALADGPHTLAVRARDAVGNVDPTPDTRTWVIDTGVPDTVIVTAPPSFSNDSTGDFTFNSPDATATFECSVDNGAFAPCTTPFATSALADGSHTFAVRARDAGDNIDPTPATHTWTVDTVAPDTVLVTFPAATTVDPTADFTFSSPDTSATFECSLDLAAFAACTTPLTTLPLAVGPHTLTVRAHDAAGNVDATPPTHAWTVLPDGDSDGLSDDDEDTFGTNPGDADSDDDGTLDGDEITPGVDSDNDGLVNARDPDSDNDGLFDGTEQGFGCANPATDSARGLCRPDADNGTTQTSPIDGDSDDGGVSDGSEDHDLNGVVGSGETDPTATHGADDATVSDTDGDGLSDGTEATLDSNPNDLDTDDDGVPDGNEPNPSADGDGDGLVDVLDVDSDDDGLFDGTELGQGCANVATDQSRGHCRADADTGTTKTSAVNPDTDGGGVRDGSEDANLDGALDTGETDPTATHGADDSTVVDGDGDGLSDGTEDTLGTDPDDDDSDDDGVLDGQEPNPSDDHDGDGDANAIDSDSDGDGLFDGTETGRDCSNAATDAAAGQCIADGDTGATVTGMLDRDTDDGGVIDGTEDTNHNGVVNDGEMDPLDATDDDDDSGEGGGGGEAGSGQGGESGEGGEGAAPNGGTDSGGSAGTAGSSGTAGDAGATGTAGTGGTGGATAGSGGSSGTGGTSGTGGSDTGGVSGSSATPDEKTVVLGGGFCSFRPASAQSQGALLSFAALALAWLSRRRRTSNPPPRL
jgi:hypothetical protein